MLAIIIPYYKLTFFESTLESLTNQTDKRFKVYIGDDASPEDCSVLLQKVNGKFDFVYHRFENNLGGTSLTKQWERCIALSQEEDWLMILGDDDVLGDNVVEAFYNNSKEFSGKAQVVRFTNQLINENSVLIFDPTTNPIWETAQSSFLRKINGQTRSSLSEYIFSKNSYSKFGFKNYPLAWHSDDKAWLDFSIDKPLFSIQKSVVFVRLSSKNISGRKDNLDCKNEASYMFLKDILSQRNSLGSRKDIASIMLFYEIIVKKNRKLHQWEWLFLLKFYLINIETISFLKFFRRYLISLLK